MHIHEEELMFSFLKTAVELISSDGLRLIICFLICNFPFLNLICLCTHTEEIFTRRVTVDQAEGPATGSLNILIGLTLKECTVSPCLN